MPTQDPTDWPSMFRRYVEWVGECEGVDFLYPPGDYHYRSQRWQGWTDEEWAAIEALWPTRSDG